MDYLLMLLLCRSVVSDSVRPRGLQPTRLPVPGILQARVLEWRAIAFSVDYLEGPYLISKCPEMFLLSFCIDY